MFKTLQNVTKLLTVVVFASGALFAAPVAPELYISDGTTTLYINDNDITYDSNPAVGVITFNGTLGQWNIAIDTTTGSTKPVLPSADVPHLHLSGTEQNATGAGTLTILFSDNFFTGVPFEGLLTAGGTNDATGASVSFDSFLSNTGVPSNILFGGSSAAAAGTGIAYPSGLGPYSTVSFSGSTLGSVKTPLNPYALTIGAVITHTAALKTTGFNLDLQGVPEPGFYGLLAVGLSGLFFVTYRRRSQSKA